MPERIFYWSIELMAFRRLIFEETGSRMRHTGIRRRDVRGYRGAGRDRVQTRSDDSEDQEGI